MARGRSSQIKVQRTSRLERVTPSPSIIVGDVTIHLGQHRKYRFHLPLWEVFCHVGELLFGLPAIQSSFLFEQLENAVLHPTEGVIFILVVPLEDVTLGKVLGRTDEEPLLNKEVTRFFLSNTDKIGHDIADQEELLDAVIPLSSDIDHSEGVGVLSTVEPVDHEVQPAYRLPVVVS